MRSLTNFNQHAPAAAAAAAAACSPAVAALSRGAGLQRDLQV